MRLPRRVESLPFSLLGLLALLDLSSAVNLDCQDILIGGHRYDLSPLKGPHAVHWIRQEDLVTRNFTFTVDLCAPLKRAKGVDKDKDCPTGTRICGMDVAYDEAGNSVLEKVVPIAGSFMSQIHKALDPKWTRLKDSDSTADANKDGLRLELNGGKYPFYDKPSRTQRAFVEFLCDDRKTGLEGDEDGGFEDDDAANDQEQKLARRVADDEQKSGHSLQFVSYKAEGKDLEIDVLRLNWTTKYACEGQAVTTPKSDHWGFFTWLIIIMFLLVASYLIFGSWLNYNRYGARGWDLVPHGDTIRDIPYYLKDFGRRAIGVFQSPARRGGYSAV